MTEVVRVRERAASGSDERIALLPENITVTVVARSIGGL